MADDLEETAADMISAVNQSMGMHCLLEVPEIRVMHGRLSGPSFYRPAIRVLEGLIETAKRNGLPRIAKWHEATMTFASCMLERELWKISASSAYDAEPRMCYDPETRQPHIVVGGGFDEGGYSI